MERTPASEIIVFQMKHIKLIKEDYPVNKSDFDICIWGSNKISLIDIFKPASGDVVNFCFVVIFKAFSLRMQKIWFCCLNKTCENVTSYRAMNLTSVIR